MSNIDWYTSREGTVTGPYSAEEIEEQIRSSRLTLLDLIYSESLARWTVLNDVAQFQEIFQQVYRARKTGRPDESHLSRPSRSGDWIVLKAFDSTSHVLGPFEKEQIFSMLSAGELRYTDSVWKPGDAGWTQLSESDDFDRRPGGDLNQNRSAPVNFESDPSPVNRIPVQDILGNIQRFNRATPIKSEERPPDVQGDDLTAPTDFTSEKIKRLVLLTLFCLGASGSVQAGPSAESVKQNATARHDAKFALFYSSKKLAELAKSLPTEVSNREQWKKDFEMAHGWLKASSSNVRTFYPQQGAQIEASSQVLLAEFEKTKKAGRGPANSEIAVESTMKVFARVQKEIGTEAAARDASSDDDN